MKLQEVMRTLPTSKNLKVRSTNALELTKLEGAEEDLLIDMLTGPKDMDSILNGWHYITFNKVDVFANVKGVLDILERYAHKTSEAENNEKYGKFPKGWNGEDSTMISASYDFSTKTLTACFRLTFNIWDLPAGEVQPKGTPNAFKYQDKVKVVVQDYTVSAVPSSRALRMALSIKPGKHITVGGLDLAYLKAKLDEKGFFS